MTDTASTEPVVLRSQRLTVEVARPGVAYHGTRFDWTGFVTQVTLDGRRTFCAPEDLRPGHGSGGIGLCSEFGKDVPAMYDDAAPGEPFPKLGVGVLIRPDRAPYRFAYPYDVQERFPIDVRASADAATFDVAPVPCRGYAARLRKTLSVTGNRLQFAYQLDNVGSRPMQVDEYAHNFVGLDGGLVGPGLSVRFPYPVAFEKETEFTTDLLADGNELTFRSIPEHPFFARLSNIAQQAGWQWALLRPDGTMAMCESVDCAPWRVVVWGQRHVLSVEVFITIALAPGESLKWTRLYEFRA